MLFFDRKRKTIARSDSENDNDESIKRKKKSSHKKRSSRITTNDEEISQDNVEQLSDNEPDDYESENEEKPKRKPTARKSVTKSNRSSSSKVCLLSESINKILFLSFRLPHDHRNQLGNINPKKRFQAVKMIRIMNHLVQ